MSDKAVNTCPFIFDFVPDGYMTQKLCYKIISEESFLLKYCLDKNKTREMSHKAADYFLLTLKFVPDWFVTSKMIRKLDILLFSNDYIVFGDLEFDFIIFFSSDIDLNSITLDKINLDDDDFDYCDPETINHVKLMSAIINIRKSKHLKQR